MNICIVGQYPPAVGGVATYTKKLEEKLKKEGHNVYILTYKQDYKHEDNVFQTKTINLPVLRAASFIISGYFMLNKIIDRYSIDIIHTNYLMPPGVVGGLIKKDVKIITTAHGSDINILSENRITKPLIKYALKNSDEIYFVSRKLKQKALKLGIKELDEKSTITPNTVDVNKFKPDQNMKNNLKNKYPGVIVMFIGNLVEQKGLKYLLEAKKLSDTRYTLLIYGEGPLKSSLSRYIKENKLENTHLMGKTAQPEKIIPQSNIMVLPSLSEGASIVALESMASAKPLIATDTGNIREVITNNTDGIIIPPADSQKLKDAIDKLVDNKEKREQISKKARKKIIEKYSEMKIPYMERI